MQVFETWKNGETGEPFVDANMKELLLTGYMSNRGRQNTASYLMHDMGINWTWGASWFENRLVDYDPSSNWLNWAYIAGVGNDPKNGRKFNIESQAERYDPKGKYVSFWLEEVSKSV
jgi:deoxyribodipyrimidine photo-lyase